MQKIGRKIIFSGITGSFLGFCYVAGYLLERMDTLDLKQMSFYIKWLAVSGMFSILIYSIWEIIYYHEKHGKVLKGLGQEFQKKKGLLQYLWNFQISYQMSIVVLLLCWLPVFFSIFPGAFAYDARGQWEQIRDGAITSHHPVIHVLLLGGLVEGLYKITGSYNVGIAVYIILQMIILSFVFSYTIKFLKKFQVPGFFQLLALIFYGISPVIQLFSISATKDVLFTAAELIFFLKTIQYFYEKELFWENRKQRIYFGITALATMILRNNGFYIVVAVLGIIGWNSRKYWKKYIITLIGILGCYLLYTGPFYHALQVTPGGVEEMLSVPIQQMSRVYKYDYDSLSQQELELLYQILPKENLEKYKETVSDSVKSGFQAEGFNENKREFFKMWIRWGVQHPLTYINAFLLNTVDIWYPHAVLDGYKDVYGKSSYFDYQVDSPGTEQVLLPGLHSYYEAISFDKEVQQKPLAFLILSPGWYFILFFLSFMYLWCHRKYKLFVPFLIFVLHFLTVLLGPMALVRYVLIFYYAFPVLPAILLYNKRYEQTEK